MKEAPAAIMRRRGLVGFARGRAAEGFNIGIKPLLTDDRRSRQWVNVLLHGLHFFLLRKQE